MLSARPADDGEFPAVPPAQSLALRRPLHELHQGGESPICSSNCSKGLPWFCSRSGAAYLHTWQRVWCFQGCENPPLPPLSPHTGIPCVALAAKRALCKNKWRQSCREMVRSCQSGFVGKSPCLPPGLWELLGQWLFAWVVEEAAAAKDTCPGLHLKGWAQNPIQSLSTKTEAHCWCQGAAACPAVSPAPSLGSTAMWEQREGSLPSQAENEPPLNRL